MTDPWLPAGFTAHKVYGLISDTHMPQRLRQFPSTLGQIFADVDLILHAGDVGDLEVLDELSAFAPVLAVHGNDDSAAAQKELPQQLMLARSGQRIMLWHGHYPDRIDEMASRHYQEMAPKLERLAGRARRAKANILVTGHWHIPYVHDAGDLLIINPGALGTGNVISRTLHQTVARLYVGPAGEAAVAHIDVNKPAEVHCLKFDPQNDFLRNNAHYNASILAPDLQPYANRLFDKIWPLAKGPILDIALELAWAVWDGEKGFIALEDWEQAVAANEQMTAAVKAEVQRRLRQFRGSGSTA